MPDEIQQFLPRNLTAQRRAGAGIIVYWPKDGARWLGWDVSFGRRHVAEAARDPPAKPGAEGEVEPDGPGAPGFAGG